MTMHNDFAANSSQGIDKLKNTYLHWTKTQLNKLHDHVSLLEDHYSKKPDSLVEDIFDLTHNIKGLGGSFGYYLITDIASSLCEYVRYKEKITEVQPYIVSAHVRAMVVVLSEEIEGSGGEEGNNIIIRLHKMVEEENNRKKA